MEPIRNWDAVLRLDNANIVDFLSSTASIFSENQWLGEKETNDFRAELSLWQNRPEWSSVSILSLLASQKSELLHAITIRIGSIALYQNVLRRSLLSLTQEIRQNLKHLSSLLIKQSELVFNQSFYIHFDNHPERRVLFASFLIEQAEMLAELYLDIDSLVEGLSTLACEQHLKSDANSNEVIAKLSERLGLKNYEDDVLPFTREANIKYKLSSTIKSFATAVAESIEQLRLNQIQIPYGYLSMLSESLSAEASLFEGIRLPFGSQIELLEIRRLSLLASLAKVSELCKNLCELYGKSISLCRSNPSRPIIQTQDLKRVLASKLASIGINHSKASASIDALFSYVEQEKLNPKQLILSEIKKINPAFTQEILDDYASIYNDIHLGVLMSEFKSKNIERASTVTKILNEPTNSVLKVLIAIMLGSSMISCGWKTGVKSDVVESRPDAPIRYEASLVDEIDESEINPGSDQSIPPQGVPFEDLDEEFEDDEENKQK